MRMRSTLPRSRSHHLRYCGDLHHTLSIVPHNLYLMEPFDRQAQLGKRIAELREAQGLSVRRLALIVGTGYSHLAKIEKGQVDVRYSLLHRIASGLGVKVGDLADDSEQESRQ